MLRRAFFLILILTILLPASFQRPIEERVAASAIPGLRVEAADSTGVTLVLDTPTYEITTDLKAGAGYQRLQVPGYEASGESGEPSLPQMNALLGVPPGARITVEVIDEQIQPVPGEYLLAPVPGPAPLEDDLTPGKLVYQPDPVIYAADALYPAAPARLVDEAWLRDQRVVQVALSPFQYNPGRGTLVWRPHLRVRVNFVGSTPGIAAGAEAGAFEPLLQGSLLNYEQARVWRGLPDMQASSLREAPGNGETSYKIVVDQDGLYRLTYAELLAAGVPVDGDPQFYALSSQGQSVAIQVEGEADGSFDPGDSLLFYGQQFRGERLADLYADSMEDWLWLCGACQLDGMFEKYTDENVYWLSIGSGPGLRMGTVYGDPDESGDPTPAYYTATVRAERSHEWFTHHFTSEDTWFWAYYNQFINAGEHITLTYTSTLTALASPALTATVSAEIVARKEIDHHTQFFLNDDTQPLDDAMWNGKTNHTFTTEISQGLLREGPGNPNELDLVLIGDGVSEQMYFNWFEISYGRLFEAEADQLLFAHEAPGTWKYQAGGFDSGAVTVLDLTYPLTPTQVLSASVQSGGGVYTATFVSTPSLGAQYYLAGSSAELSAKSITPYTSLDLSTAEADYVFITPQAFYTPTQTLADYRAAQGLTTLIVDIDELYNQFNFGIYNPVAIKNFLEYTFANWTTPPTYALLVGDGHWNLKAFEGIDAPPIYMPPNLAFVDPWQGEVDSANLLAAVVGDDILADVLIGRVPVASEAEFNTIIGKIQDYESSGTASWQQEILFAVDDPDAAGDFEALAQGLIDDYVTGSPYYQATRIDYDEFGSTTHDEIVAAINDPGALMVNYLGHGSVQNWGGPSLFTNADIGSLTNEMSQIVLLSMTCLDGYWIHPEARPSLVVEMVNTPDKGAVAAFSATGLGVATGHDYLQRGFFSSLFDDGIWTLGAAAQNGKVHLYTSGSVFFHDLIHTFTVFGDPALQILNPYNVGLAPGAQALQGDPGSTMFYDLQVTNTGILTDTIAVEISENNWPTTPSPVEILDLAPGSTITFTVQVTIPVGVSGWDVAEVTVVSQGDTSRTGVATLNTFTDAQQLFLPVILK